MSGRFDLRIKAAGGVIYRPVVLDGVELKHERKGAPSTLEFTVIKEGDLSFAHGNWVSFYVDGTCVFQGRVFTKTRDKKQHIKVTCYDQLRYLKNKDSILYTNSQANAIIKDCLERADLNFGVLPNINVMFNRLNASDKTYFDTIQSVFDGIYSSKKKLYVIYDDCGNIKVKDVEDMKTNYVLNSQTAENFDYTSTIDNNTYNNVVVIKESQNGQRQIEQKCDPFLLDEYGKLTLRYTTQLDNLTGIAEKLLEYYKKEERTLSVKNCFGDIRVRGGSSVIASLPLGDTTKINNVYLMCERVTHHFKNDHHTMDLDLRGNIIQENVGL